MDGSGIAISFQHNLPLCIIMARVTVKSVQHFSLQYRFSVMCPVYLSTVTMSDV